MVTRPDGSKLNFSTKWNGTIGSHAYCLGIQDRKIVQVSILSCEIDIDKLSSGTL